jgi:hypothetical protein
MFSPVASSDSHGIQNGKYKINGFESKKSMYDEPKAPDFTPRALIQQKYFL